MTILDNDLHGLDRPRSMESWTFREQTMLGVRFWDAVAHELDNALVRTVGPERWTTYLEEIFRVQQEKYFAGGCDLLGIPAEVSDTTRCALYHCLSTALAGSRSRFAVESETKAWIFYLPNIMSVASPAHRRDLQLAAYRGWYVHNGTSLGNDQIAFVVTHLVADGDPFDAGYFEDAGRSLSPDERLRFEPGAQPPAPAMRQTARLDAATWPEERRLKALRNLIYGWAWDHTAAAGLLLGDAGLVATTHAFNIVLGSYRPFFDAALGGEGPDFWTRYWLSVHELGGAQPGTDPVLGSSFEISTTEATRVHEAVRLAWATVSAEEQVRVELCGDASLSFS